MMHVVYNKETCGVHVVGMQIPKGREGCVDWLPQKQLYVTADVLQFAAHAFVHLQNELTEIDVARLQYEKQKLERNLNDIRNKI